jgi:hypothetical protein
VGGFAQELAAGDMVPIVLCAEKVGSASFGSEELSQSATLLSLHDREAASNMRNSILDTPNWSDHFHQLPKPNLTHFYKKSTDSDLFSWIQLPNREDRALAYLWLYDLVSLELEIRRALAEAKAVKGWSITGDPEAHHIPFRYHADNACYRIFAFLDKVGQLLNACLDLKVERPSFKTVIQVVRKRSELSTLDSMKPFLELNDSEWYKALSEYRHSLSHRLGPVSQDQASLLSLLKGVKRHLEFEPIGYTIDQLDNLISDGHKRVVAIIESCETVLATTTTNSQTQ